MKNARDTLQGDLEQIERLVVAPTGDLCVILEQVKKMMTKRSHKLLDYDRYRDGVQTLKSKQGRTSSEEKKLAQLEVQFDQATREYNAINNQLKQDLAVFLSLRHAFIDPCLLTFYNYQIRVYQTLYTIFYQVGHAQFDLNTSAMDGYRDHQDAVQQMLNKLSITKPIVRTSLDKPPSYQDTQDSLGPSAAAVTVGSQKAPLDPPMMKPVSSEPPRLSLDLHSSSKYVIAVYDFEAQAPGDLSFRKDDKIEVLEQRDVNDWWVGRIGGRTGQFPGNYVRFQ
jgi:amphiphysin